MTSEPGVSLARGPVLRPLTDILPVVAETGPADRSVRQPGTPDPRGPALAEAVLRAAVEFIAGQRSARQLSPMLAPPVMSYLSGLRGAAGPLRPRLRGASCQQPAPGALEANGLVLLRTGTRAVFARFELTGPDRAHWTCQNLHLPLTRGDLNVARRAR